MKRKKKAVVADSLLVVTGSVRALEFTGQATVSFASLEPFFFLLSFLPSFLSFSLEGTSGDCDWHQDAHASREQASRHDRNSWPRAKEEENGRNEEERKKQRRRRRRRRRSHEEEEAMQKKARRRRRGRRQRQFIFMSFP
jgi:hypothetical protein